VARVMGSTLSLNGRGLAGRARFLTCAQTVIVDADFEKIASPAGQRLLVFPCQLFYCATHQNNKTVKP
jgi:hypothetical protein